MSSNTYVGEQTFRDKYLMKKYFKKWYSRTSLKDSQKNFDIFCKTRTITYIEEHKSQIKQSVSIFIPLLSQIILMTNSIFGILYTNIINSEICIDFIRYQFRRMVRFNHWVRQIYQYTDIEDHIDRLGQTLQSGCMSNDQYLDFHKKINRIWNEEIVKYLETSQST